MWAVNVFSKKVRKVRLGEMHVMMEWVRGLGEKKNEKKEKKGKAGR